MKFAILLAILAFAAADAWRHNSKGEQILIFALP